jgi:hypothetical protein
VHSSFCISANKSSISGVILRRAGRLIGTRFVNPTLVVSLPAEALPRTAGHCTNRLDVEAEGTDYPANEGKVDGGSPSGCVGRTKVSGSVET